MSEPGRDELAVVRRLRDAAEYRRASAMSPDIFDIAADVIERLQHDRIAWLAERLGSPDIIEAVTQAIFDGRGMVIETRERVLSEIARLLTPQDET